MPLASGKVEEVLGLVERVADVWESLRGEPEGDDDQGAAESEREDLLAEILDESEEAQAKLAAALATTSGALAEKVQTGDAEAAALAAVVLRALAAHTQAEAIRGLMESPDISQFVNVSEAPDDLEEYDDGGGDE